MGVIYMAKIINLKSEYEDRAYSARADELISESALKEIKSNEEHCVFISHKSDDKEEARKIANYLKNDIGVDIYLDEFDYFLNQATGNGDSEKVVKIIKNAIGTSTHLLSLVSSKTKMSWWVPYEIGIADEKNRDIASLKLAKAEGIPEFLEIKTCLQDEREFVNYYEKLKSGRTLFLETNRNFQYKAELNNILD